MQQSTRVATTTLGELETARGRVTIVKTANSVHRITVVGFLDEDHARYWIAKSDPDLAENHAEAFCDWAEMTGYDSNARKILTDWALARRSRTRFACFLVRPGIVAMGVSVAAMALSLTGLPVESTSERAKFEELFVERSRRRDSTVPPTRR